MEFHKEEFGKMKYTVVNIILVYQYTSLLQLVWTLVQKNSSFLLNLTSPTKQYIAERSTIWSKAVLQICYMPLI